ncbi:hypothetical protein BD626DRAFT_575474 [Schizophyllum amplum]|uniref:RING-type domain-containing protein n=1 Tax=Schizophyllum amplum TaxID=97359 RepID=A0A550BVN7_9AGAR|nr:hypothetical protein BD626DRAFT_575474 [Auriculariopsis ampla]
MPAARPARSHPAVSYNGNPFAGRLATKVSSKVAVKKDTIDNKHVYEINDDNEDVSLVSPVHQGTLETREAIIVERSKLRGELRRAQKSTTTLERELIRLKAESQLLKAQISEAATATVADAGVTTQLRQELELTIFECGICMERIDNPYEANVCGHVFCKACILEWAEASPSAVPSCPTCRLGDEEDFALAPISNLSAKYFINQLNAISPP